MKLRVCMFLLLGTAAFAQPNPDTLWTRLTGGGFNDQATASELTSDGGFVVVGQTRSYGAGDSDAWIVKYDANGDTVWTTTVGGAGFDVASDVHELPDGGFVVVGQTEIRSTSDDAWVIRLSSDGDTLWTRLVYSGSGIERAYGVDVLPDTSFIVCGSRSLGGSQMYVFRMTQYGDTLWTRRYGGGGTEVGEDVIVESDGSYLFAGYTSSYGAGAESVYILKTNANGDSLWMKVYGGAQTDLARKIRKNPLDDGYYVCGQTMSAGLAAGDFYLLRLNSDGDTIWTRTCGLSGGSGESILVGPDGGAYMAGFANGALLNQMYLFRYDPAGTQIWSRSYGGNGNDYGYDIEQAADGGFILSGFSASFTATFDFYVVRTGPEASLVLNTPNGGETWTILNSHTVSWFSADPGTGVDIELNRDYPGGVWELLADNTADDGSEIVAVTSPASNTCRVRITQQPSGSVDISDADFSISPSQGLLRMVRSSDLGTPLFDWITDTVECGFIRTIILRYKNIGSDSLIVFHPEPLNGPHFTYTTTCSYPLALGPGENTGCNVTLRFDPEADGTFFDTLFTRTNAANAVNEYVAFPMAGGRVSGPDRPEEIITSFRQDSVRIFWNPVLTAPGGCVLDPPVNTYNIYSSIWPDSPYTYRASVNDTFYVEFATDSLRHFRVTADDPTP